MPCPVPEDVHRKGHHGAETGPKGSPPGVKVKGLAHTSLLFQPLYQEVSLEAEVEQGEARRPGGSAHARSLLLGLGRGCKSCGCCTSGRGSSWDPSTGTCSPQHRFPGDGGTCSPLRAGPLRWCQAEVTALESGRGAAGCGEHSQPELRAEQPCRSPRRPAASVFSPRTPGAQ